MGSGVKKVSIPAIVLTSILVLTLIGCDNAAAQANNSGYNLLEQGRYDQAIAKFDEAIRLDPGLATPYHNRGRSYFELEEYDKAIDDFSQFLRLAPDASSDDAYTARTFRGLSYISDVIPPTIVGPSQRFLPPSEKAKIALAIEDYSEAIRLKPQHKEPYAGRAEAYAKLGMASRAWQDVERAVQRGWTNTNLERRVENALRWAPTN